MLLILIFLFIEEIILHFGEGLFFDEEEELDLSLLLL